MKLPNLITILLLCSFHLLSGQGQDNFQYQVDTLIKVSKENYVKRDLDQALNFAEKALDLAHSSRDSSLLIGPYSLISQIHIDRRDIAEANKYLDRLMNLGVLLSDTFRIMEVIGGRAAIATIQGEHEKAVLLYEDAEKLAIAIGSERVVKLLMNKSNSLNSLGLYREALENYTKGIKHFKEHHDSLALAIAYNNIGELYREGLNEPEDALTHYRMAVKINTAIDNIFDLSKNYNNIGLLFSLRENYDSAHFYLTESLRLKQQMGDEGGEAVAAYNLGKSYFRQGMADEAEGYFLRALKISEKLNIPPGIFYSNEGMAGVSELRNNQTARLEHLLKAKEAADQLNDLNLEISIRNELYRYHTDHQNYRQANVWLEEVNLLLDSLHSSVSPNDFAQVKMNYEMDLREAENEILKESQQKSQALLKASQRETLILIVSIVGLGLIIALLWIGILQRNKRLRHEKGMKAELLEQNKRLLEQEARLKELNHIKNRIFSILGHDLRAPLSTISSYMELLQLNGLSEEEREPILTHLKSETHVTLKTLENILAWARLQMNEKNDLREEISLRDIIQDIKDLFEPIAAVKQVKLKIRLKGELKLKGNEYQLRSLISNLVSNAIKFSPEGSEVGVYVLEDNEQIELRVADSGSGIPITTLDELSAGKVVKSSHGTRGESGTGIGLNLVREFVESHCGKIEFQTNNPQGTIVKVVMPLDCTKSPALQPEVV